MNQIGFKLININDGSVIDAWGGTPGQCPAPPAVIFLPNDVQVFCPELDKEYYGYKIINWYSEDSI